MTLLWLFSAILNVSSVNHKHCWPFNCPNALHLFYCPFCFCCRWWNFFFFSVTKLYVPFLNTTHLLKATFKKTKYVCSSTLAETTYVQNWPMVFWPVDIFPVFYFPSSTGVPRHPCGCECQQQDGLSLLAVIESDWDVKENRLLSGSEGGDGRREGCVELERGWRALRSKTCRTEGTGRDESCGSGTIKTETSSSCATLTCSISVLWFWVWRWKIDPLWECL